MDVGTGHSGAGPRTALALLAFGMLASLAAGCATGTARPPRSEFEDIAVPRGLTYQPDKSTVIESPAVKAARLVYRGRLEPVSLGQQQLAIRLKPVGPGQEQLIGMDFNLSEVEYRNREPLLARGDGTKRAAAQQVGHERATSRVGSGAQPAVDGIAYRACEQRRSCALGIGFHAIDHCRVHGHRQ